MSILEPSFWKYLTFDDEGFVNGISPDAPEKEKKAYEEFTRLGKESGAKV